MARMESRSSGSMAKSAMSSMKCARNRSSNEATPTAESVSSEASESEPMANGAGGWFHGAVSFLK